MQARILSENLKSNILEDQRREGRQILKMIGRKYDGRGMDSSGSW
jgi:hypothetical protein